MPIEMLGRGVLTKEGSLGRGVAGGAIAFRSGGLLSGV